MAEFDHPVFTTVACDFNFDLLSKLYPESYFGDEWLTFASVADSLQSVDDLFKPHECSVWFRVFTDWLAYRQMRINLGLTRHGLTELLSRTGWESGLNKLILGFVCDANDVKVSRMLGHCRFLTRVPNSFVKMCLIMLMDKVGCESKRRSHEWVCHLGIHHPSYEPAPWEISCPPCDPFNIACLRFGLSELAQSLLFNSKFCDAYMQARNNIMMGHWVNYFGCRVIARRYCKSQRKKQLRYLRRLRSKGKLSGLPYFPYTLEL